jgi:hypothetical protein
MVFWRDIKKAVLDTCMKYGKEYEDICVAIIEDISQYRDLTEAIKRKIRGGLSGRG